MAFFLPGLRAQTNLLANSGFESGAGSAPDGWTISNQLPYGIAALSSAARHAGLNSLSVVWNAGSNATVYASPDLGAAQAVAASGLLGKTLYASAWVNATDGATAMVNVLAYRSDGHVYKTTLRQGQGTGLVQVRDTLDIPNDPRILFVLFLCQMEGTGTAFFDDVFLSTQRPADWPGDSSVTVGAGAPLQATVTIKASTLIRSVPATFYGQNLEWIWNGNGAWDAGGKRPEPEVAKLAKDLRVSLLRFPGGIMADYYDWRAAVGPVASRPALQSLPGGSVDKPYFGTDEALQFAAAAGAELLITVNAGTGNAQMAADWVRYVNASGLRVRYWEVGNELYVKSGPMFAPVTLTPEQYAAKYLEFAKAMRAADPRIQIGAIACESLTTLDCPTYPNWTAKVLQKASGEIDFLSVHNAYAPAIDAPAGLSTTDAYLAMLAAPQHVRRSLDSMVRKINTNAPARASQIKIAVTEWGPYFSHSIDNRFAEHTKTMASAVFVADAFKVFLESKKTEITNAFQLVDGIFTGWIGRQGDALIPKPSYLAMSLFSNHFGSRIVSSASVSPTFDVKSVGALPPASAVPYVDSVASKSPDGKTLYVMVWNKHPANAADVTVKIQGFTPAANCTVRTLSGAAADAHTGTETFSFIPVVPQAVMEGASRFYPSQQSNVTLAQATLAWPDGEAKVTVPPMSLRLFTLPAR